MTEQNSMLVMLQRGNRSIARSHKEKKKISNLACVKKK